MFARYSDVAIYLIKPGIVKDNTRLISATQISELFVLQGAQFFRYIQFISASNWDRLPIIRFVIVEEQLCSKKKQHIVYSFFALSYF